MDPASLAVGAVPLFNSCLQYFQLFKTAQYSALDIQVLLFQLDCHHLEFSIWGEKHGFFSGNNNNDPQSQADRPKELLGRIETALVLLETLFKDARVLNERYGVDVRNDGDGPSTTEHDTGFPSSAGLRRLRWWKTQGKQPSRAAGTQLAMPAPGVWQKTRWAIYDKEKFESLVRRIGDVVGQIEKLLPVPDEFRNQAAICDIVSINDDLSLLKLFRTASATIRPAWSNAASSLIIASEAASTRGPGTISRWIEELELDDANSDQGDSSSRPPEGKLPGLLKPKEPCFSFRTPYGWNLWFAMLPTCPSSSMGLSCDLVCLELRNDCPTFIGHDDGDKKWGLGPKLKSVVDGASKVEGRLETISNMSINMQDTLAEGKSPDIHRYLDDSKMHIYCAPCRPAVRAALILARQKVAAETHVRIDDRIQSSCCNAGGISGRLQSFVDTVNARELRRSDRFPEGSQQEDVDYVDKEWIERRIYMLESEQYSGQPSTNPLKAIDGFLDDMEKSQTVHSVVLQEANTGGWILRTPPFRTSPLVAKELQLFKYRFFQSLNGTGNSNFAKKGVFRGTFTPSPLYFPGQETENPPSKRPRHD